jgi:DNA polymerase-3 subunit alpha
MATQLDMYDVEDVGLVKFDFLGLRTLTVINNAVRSIERVNPDFKLKEIPFDDAKVFNLLSSGKTKGLFQLESSGMIDLIKRLKPENFSDIVALVALYRPGPLNSGMADDYINRKNGRESIAYQHTNLKKVLNETYGVFVYQEQVMEAAQVLASYSLGDADNLRRAMGKKKADVMEEEKGTFVAGCKNNNIPENKAIEIFDNIEKFAGYGFNKSHSAAYAFIAYQTAYLKTHYPSHFIASVLSSEQDKTDKLEPHVKDCGLMGIEILPPDINTSFETFIVNDKNQIEYGLGALKDVGRKFIEEVCKERSNGKFTSLMDFASRIDLRKGGIRSLQSLAKSGAFDDIADRDLAVSSMRNYLEASEQKI